MRPKNHREEIERYLKLIAHRDAVAAVQSEIDRLYHELGEFSPKVKSWAEADGDPPENDTREIRRLSNELTAQVEKLKVLWGLS